MFYDCISPPFFSVDINLILFQVSLPARIYRFCFFPNYCFFFFFLFWLVSLFHVRYFPQRLVILGCLLLFKIRALKNRMEALWQSVTIVLCCLSQWDVLWELLPNSLRHLCMKCIIFSPLNLEYISYTTWENSENSHSTSVFCSSDVEIWLKRWSKLAFVCARTRVRVPPIVNIFSLFFGFSFLLSCSDSQGDIFWNLSKVFSLIT